VKEFKLKSVLNTDRYDRRKYGELRSVSKKLQKLEGHGKQQLSTFPDLLGDVWAGLYKYEPRLAEIEDIKEEVKPHQVLMEKLMENTEYQGLREYTKIDELASALGAIQMGDALKKLLKDNNAADKIEKSREKEKEAEQYRNKAETLKQAAQNETDEDKKSELQKQAKSNSSKAARLMNKAKQLNGQAIEELVQYLESQKGKDAVNQAVAEAANNTKIDTDATNSLIKGLGYGVESGSQETVSAKERIRLSETIQGNPKLKEIAVLAGRMKRIAQKKQKSKNKNSVVKTTVATGNDPQSLLPQEIVQLRKRNTRKEFLQRFAEGKTLQYVPRSNEKLGKGPIIICLDTSGSMVNLDREAKAVMIALLAIAKKQNRAFAVINFASATQCRTWTYEKPKKVKPKVIVEMAEHFFDGGTDFNVPLSKALWFLRQNKYKKGDVIFITDGRCSVRPDLLAEIEKEKRRKKFSIISIQMDTGAGNAVLKEFSDKLVVAKSLFDQKATEAVFSI